MDSAHDDSCRARVNAANSRYASWLLSAWIDRDMQIRDRFGDFAETGTQLERGPSRAGRELSRVFRDSYEALSLGVLRNLLVQPLACACCFS